MELRRDLCRSLDPKWDVGGFLEALLVHEKDRFAVDRAAVLWRDEWLKLTRLSLLQRHSRRVCSGGECLLPLLPDKLDLDVLVPVDEEACVLRRVMPLFRLQF